jgi:small subunit ribosomal protein S2
MPAASMKQLLESGVHFGHQTRRWNPKMKPYIFTERGGIHIIDLQQTTVLLDRAYDFVRNISSRGGTVLFVGTKKQCQDIVRDEAGRVGMPYVSHRWLGGLLTNFTTIADRIKRMHELRKLKEEGQLGLLPTKERMAMERELEKLEINLGGVSTMTRLPDAVFVADPKREAIATKEVIKLGLPLIGLVDTNCDPDEVDYLIPGNDDAIRSCGLIVRTLARAVEEGRQKVQIAEFLAAEAARASAEAQARSAAAATEGAMGGGLNDAAPSRVSRAPRSTAGEGRPGGQGRPGPGGRPGGPGRPGPRDGGPVRSGPPARTAPPARRPAAATPVSGPKTDEAAPKTDLTVKEKAAETPTAQTAIGEVSVVTAPVVTAPEAAPESAAEAAPAPVAVAEAEAFAAPEAVAEVVDVAVTEAASEVAAEAGPDA